MAFLTSTLDSSRWLAVSRRDGAANSSFYYGAISTRIFCRPTCTGRLARRSNVVFFDNQNQALSTGYRPCKRCQPCNDEWSRGNEGRMLAQRLRNQIIVARTEGTPWTVEAFAKELGISGAHLHRQFKKHYLVTPKTFEASLGHSGPPKSSHVSAVDGKMVNKGPIAGIHSDGMHSRVSLGVVPIEGKPERGRTEQAERQAMLEYSTLDDSGMEDFSIEFPSIEFLDFTELEGMLDLG